MSPFAPSQQRYVCNNRPLRTSFFTGGPSLRRSGCAALRRRSGWSWTCLLSRPRQPQACSTPSECPRKADLTAIGRDSLRLDKACGCLAVVKEDKSFGRTMSSFAPSQQRYVCNNRPLQTSFFTGGPSLRRGGSCATATHSGWSWTCLLSRQPGSHKLDPFQVRVRVRPTLRP